MSVTVCLFSKALYYPDGGGHIWLYLNWALGLRSLGCKVVWMEGVYPETPNEDLHPLVASLKARLEKYGLSEHIALCSLGDAPLAEGATNGYLNLEEAIDADLLIDMGYELPSEVVSRFRRSVLIDVDPGLTQIWISEGQLCPAKHDVYFTIGETVGKPGSPIPDVGIEWQYTPPSVALDYWPPWPAKEETAPFSTVSQWSGGEWVKLANEIYQNDKREGFRPFFDLPRYTSQPLELALGLGESDAEECVSLRNIGWRVRDSHSVAGTPWDYQGYLQHSRGEFSCVKPSCIKLQNAWMSDRTICYLASGKPAIVQHTGPSRFLPDEAGLFRFHTLEEAARCVEMAANDYGRQSKLARSLAEEYFDARKNLAKVLEHGLN